LISTPLANQETIIKIKDSLVSRPYIDATLKIIEKFGGKITEDGAGFFKITPLQKYTPISFKVPGDFSSASFILAGGALTQGDVSITGLDFNLPQGDEAIIDILKKMGVNVSVDLEKGIVKTQGTEHIDGGEFNLSDTPDLLPVVALLACKCEDEVIISGVKHARLKETDRISVLAEELPKLGVSVIEKEDGLKIIGTKKLKQCTLNTHGDHRMALAFTIAGMISQNGCLIEDFESVVVSYPRFKEDIHSLGGKLEPVDN
jgi:3-phosphoshikimate 1-carboxyvinyltransferase